MEDRTEMVTRNTKSSSIKIIATIKWTLIKTGHLSMQDEHEQRKGQIVNYTTSQTHIHIDGNALKK